MTKLKHNLPVFKNKGLFEQAFIHRSYLNEAKKKISSNERLEFLGDSIISYVVSKYLFDKYPTFNEGKLTNLRSLLVNTQSLGSLGSDLKFGDLLVLSKGEEDTGGRKNQTILANCFEAFIGALFIDQGIEEVKKFLEKTLLIKTEDLVRNKTFKDPKSILQEKIQSQERASPIYKVIEEEGPPHSKTFTVAVYAGNSFLAEGKGKSKQQAEQNAAIQALSLNK